MRFPANSFLFLFKDHPHPMWIINSENYFLDINHSALELLGYSLNELTNRILWEVCRQDNEANEIVVSLDTRWGDTIRAKAVVYPVEWNGRECFVYQLIKVEKPLSPFESLNAEQELARFKMIAQHTSDLIAFTNTRNEIVWVNPAFEKISGFKLNEIDGHDLISLLAGSDTKPDVLRFIREKRNVLEHFRYEVLWYSKEGTTFWVDAEEIPFLGKGKVKGYMVIYRDVSHIKLAIREMLEAHEILRTVMDHAPLKVFVKDSRGKVVFYNKGFIEGILNNGYINKNDLSQISLLSHEDKEILLNGITCETKENMLINGRSHEFLAFKFPLLDANGKRASIGNIWIDVTDNMHAKRALKESEGLYFSTVSSINDAVIALDMSMKITYLNPSAERLTGYTIHEILGKNFNDVIKIREVDELDEVYQPMETSGSFFDHLILTSREGIDVPIGDGNISAVVSADGRQTGMVMTFKNISDKLRREQLERELEVKRLTAVIEGQEKERARLARELHDGLGQMLNLIKINVDLITEGERSDISRLIEETIQETARISENLLPSKLRDFDLATALEALCRQVEKTSSMAVQFHCFGEVHQMDESRKINIYRIAQEALNNAVKHAHATSVSVTLNDSFDLLRLSVEDNGLGLGSAESEGSFHHGMSNMIERAEIMGGELFIDSKADMGTVIIVEVPKLLANKPENTYGNKYSYRSG